MSIRRTAATVARRVFALLWICAAIAQAGDAVPASQPPAAASIPVAAARWDGPGISIEVDAGGGGSVAADPMPALLHYVVGVAALPMVLLNPPAVLGWPFYIILGAPAQGAFNSRVQALGEAFAAVPLPAAIVDALRAQWTAADGSPPAQIKLRILSYGLVTASGRNLEALGAGEALCLAAQADLQIASDGAPPRSQLLAIVPGSSTPDAPPPICESLSAFAHDHGLRLRQAIGELAEILAALTLRQAAAVP